MVVEWDLKTWSSIRIKWNVKVLGDIDLWTNSEVNWSISWRNIKISTSSDLNNIVANWNLDLWTNSVVKSWMYVKWDLETWSSVDIKWYSKILWNIKLWTNSDISWTFYWYKNFDSGSSINFYNNKLKIVWDTYFWTNTDNTWRLYIFWKKTFWTSYEESLKNFSGFFASIDPILNYTLTENEIINIKSKTDSYLLQANNIQYEINLLEKQRDFGKADIKKQEKLDLYKKMFEYLAYYIENESFDLNVFTQIKSQYIWNLEVNPIQTQNSNIKSSEKYLPQELKIKLNNIVEKIPSEQRIHVIIWVNKKIDEIILSLWKKSYSIEVSTKIDMLKSMKIFLEEKLY